MITKTVVKLSESVNLVQIFEKDSNGYMVGEYQDIEIHDPGSGRVHVISFVKPEITVEALRTAADEIDMERLVNLGFLT